jgi:hypothetical protein
VYEPELLSESESEYGTSSILLGKLNLNRIESFLSTGLCLGDIFQASKRWLDVLKIEDLVKTGVEVSGYCCVVCALLPFKRSSIPFDTSSSAVGGGVEHPCINPESRDENEVDGDTVDCGGEFCPSVVDEYINFGVLSHL